MPLCIAAGGVAVALALDSFTLAWMHSIEKLRWEEDYRVEGSALRLTEARILGSGAGMDPPAGARLERGVWHYTPALPPLPVLRLMHSHFTTGYELCHDGRCRPLTEVLPGLAEGTVELSVCDEGSHPPALADPDSRGPRRAKAP
jgi:hypothetical protein